MWLLINVMQLVVFMSMMLINQPSLLKLTFDLIEKVVEGKFWDDLKIGEHMMNVLGLSFKEETPSE